nr:hypothetical protein [uncultured Sphingomonas sp.]
MRKRHVALVAIVIVAGPIGVGDARISGLRPTEAQVQTKGKRSGPHRTQTSEAKEKVSKVSEVLAGFKLTFPSSAEAAAPGYIEFFHDDGRWLAEITGRVTINHRGRWRVSEDRVCVDFDKGEKDVCRRVAAKQNGDVTLSNIFSDSSKSFRLSKSKI